MHLPRRRIVRHDFLDRTTTPERVLVVVFLRGGADCLSLVAPVQDDAYQKARPLLAVKPEDGLPLDDYFALHPGLTELHGLYRDGQLGLVHGAGSEDGTRSHFEAQDTMEHGGNLGSGWLGRYLRAAGPDLGALAAVSIGTTRPESMRGAPVGAVMQTMRDFDVGAGNEAMLDDLRRLYASVEGQLGTAATQTIGAVERLRDIRAQIAAAGDGGAYPDTNFGRGLREIARLIKADVGLVASTIDRGGWDTHAVQSRLIGDNIRDLSVGIDAFMQDLDEHRDRVDVIVMTEFGRRLRENSAFGTDHGAGSAMMVVGDAAGHMGIAGRVVRPWPDLSDGHLDAVGDIPATINYRDVLAPILTMHRPAIDAADVFPDHTVVGVG